MVYTTIEVPAYNDSYSRVVLDSTVYYIRFTYDDTGDFWKFGLYSSLKEPIVIGMKIVPMFPLNIFHGTETPEGIFLAKTNLSRIGHEDFWNEKAEFMYCTL